MIKPNINEMALELYGSLGNDDFQRLLTAMSELARTNAEQSGNMELFYFQIGKRHIGHLICEKLKIKTFKELSRYREDEVLAVNGVGPTSLTEVKRQMLVRGLTLSTYPRAHRNSNHERNYQFIQRMIELKSLKKACAGLMSSGNARTVFMEVWREHLTYKHNLSSGQISHLKYGGVDLKADYNGINLAELASPYMQSGKAMTEVQGQELLAFAKEYYLQ